ncbi:MAG TPA: hypothetical protein P5142_00195 [Spirochaetia bacterium]|nr:hypothetical protein [Spirochaetia bacterium]
MATKTYDTAPEAARASQYQKAISNPRKLQTPRGQYQVVIVYERGSYRYVYQGALAHTLPDTLARPSSSDIDSERRWRPW